MKKMIAALLMSTALTSTTLAGGQLGVQLQNARRIVTVFPNSPASQYGLSVGDVILQVNEKIVISSREIAQIVAANSDSELRLRIARNGTERDIIVRFSQTTTPANNAAQAETVDRFYKWAWTWTVNEDTKCSTVHESFEQVSKGKVDRVKMLEITQFVGFVLIAADISAVAQGRPSFLAFDGLRYQVAAVLQSCGQYPDKTLQQQALDTYENFHESGKP